MSSSLGSRKRELSSAWKLTTCHYSSRLVRALLSRTRFSFVESHSHDELSLDLIDLLAFTCLTLLIGLLFVSQCVGAEKEICTVRMPSSVAALRTAVYSAEG